MGMEASLQPSDTAGAGIEAGSLPWHPSVKSDDGHAVPPVVGTQPLRPAPGI
jgi:hypothetical protein